MRGSSPLARGTPVDPRRAVAPGRFIPARAGNTRPAWTAAATPSVHPRSRGEHHGWRLPDRCEAGSSPLARGTLPFCRRCSPRARFIPARAGNTAACDTSHGTRSVHPRSRGEHIAHDRSTNNVVGSSPLARGTRITDIRHARNGRFIPARAGNTRGRCRRRRAAPVHPRSRGEHRRTGRRRRRENGSSPLARGTREPRRRAGPRLRFIPARAGNTTSTGRRLPKGPVHPRSRGEHITPAQIRAVKSGSSPLARGTRRRGRRQRRQGRFIPARAGNTSPSTT